MDEITDVYERPYKGYPLSHDYWIEEYTVRKLSSGDYEIYVQEGTWNTGGALTVSLNKDETEGKTFEEVAEMLPEYRTLKDEILKNEELKCFLGFCPSENEE